MKCLVIDRSQNRGKAVADYRRRLEKGAGLRIGKHFRALAWNPVEVLTSACLWLSLKWHSPC